MGQKFSKAFGAKFKDKNEKEKYLWTTAYGPAMSRILVSIIATHGDEKGLVLPWNLTPLQIVIIPIFKKENKEKILKECEELNKKIKAMGLTSEIDSTEKSPGEKFNIWELKGVPFRLEIGEKEIKEKKATLFLRDLKKKEKIGFKEISKLKELGKEYDKRIKEKSDKMFEGKIIDCESKEDLKKIIEEGKIARINFCSTEKEGEKCAEFIEKQTRAEIRGTLGNKKEKASGKCIICGTPAKEVVYAGRSY
jgi:prolyl-tRNA synthetase